MCALVVLAVGCERAPLDCPSIEPGSLVITEITSGEDGGGLGEWIELFNASNATIDLLGTRIEFTTLDGGSTQEFTVRRQLTVGAGAYVTFGRFADEGRPDHIDYGYASDLDTSFLSRAAVEVVVCGEEVDQAIYRELPADGSLALDGAVAPSATTNDVEANFCTDSLGGTPREENRPCT